MVPPRLRPLEAVPVVEDGRTYMALRDPEGYATKVVFLSPLDALIACRLNGRSSVAEISSAIGRQTRQDPVPVKRITALIKVLDENLMLESERFLKHKEEITAAFRQAPERPPTLAGLSYEADKNALAKTLEGFFSLPEAPGELPQPDGDKPLTGLVAPHIDYARGKVGYAWAYGDILRRGLADLYVILGVAHMSPATPIVLTGKDFGTPFGPAQVDKTLCRRLAEKAPYDLLSDELTHRTEHSIELQAVFLKFAQSRLGGDFKILPLLFSSCDLQGSEPGKRTLDVFKHLEPLLRDYPGRVCLLAGVDLAHVGPCFGDEEQLTPKFLEEVRKQDQKSLAFLLARDPEGFLGSVMDDGNKRKVCGVSALHAFTWLHKRLFPESKGELRHYGSAADPSGGKVTFASVSFS